MIGLEVGKVKVRVTAVAICGGPGHEHVAVSVADRAGNTGTWYGHLSDAAMKGTAGTLRDLGWDPEGRDWRLEEIHDTGLLVGVEAVAVVVDEEYRGRRRRKIRWLNAPSRVAGGMDGADVAALGACLRARCPPWRGAGLMCPSRRGPRCFDCDLPMDHIGEAHWQCPGCDKELSEWDLHAGDDDQW